MKDIVLLPGFMCDAGLWEEARPALERLGRLHFADLTRDRNFAAMADRVLASAPQHFALAGFSMGGFVAREIALKAPERVVRLALLNTSARGDSAAETERKAGLAKAVDVGGFRGLSRQSILSSLHPERRDDGRLVGTVRAMAARIGKDGFVNQMSVMRPDGRAALGRIACPTLVVWCRQDALRSREEAEELAAGIPGAYLEIVEECGHMLPLEAPERMAALLSSWMADAHVPGAFSAEVGTGSAPRKCVI